MGADIIKRALNYPIKLIANNAGVNGSVVMQKVRPLMPLAAAAGRRGCAARLPVAPKSVPAPNL
jgi:hypothetical protein